MLAASALMADPAYAGLSKPGPHFTPKAKNVILCFMPGGVSQMDTFDPKPKLNELHGKSSGSGKRTYLKSLWSFKQYGQCGAWVSELLPQLATCVDDMTIVRSMKSGFPLHPRGNILFHTGRNVGGHPSLGSWITYALGSENRNLPGYVLLHSGAIPPGGMENFSNGYLPATHQATPVRADGIPIDNLAPGDRDAHVQQSKLAVLRQQDGDLLRATGANDAIESAIANYEMAYRMQSLVPDVLNLDRESAATRKLYGIGEGDAQRQGYSLQCLRARRLVESGVRFVEITPPVLFNENNGTWDQHGNLKKGHEGNALVADQAVAALLKDLKSRGMLGETLVIWGTEFGRTPDSANGDGRDHLETAFTIWMAGGGVKGGLVYGATDELAKEVTENVTEVYDLHATILHLLGLDHERLTYRFGGRDMRLTDVHGKVVRAWLG
ncbi:MAG: DUF1501 domain-containing protein [Acidobacteria bacterium]|nr:DUF1501 domain-containing protein [Acidobacteriota bacterium]